MYKDTKPEPSPVNDMICHEPLAMFKPHRRPDVIAHAQLVNDKLYTESIDYVARDHLYCQDDTYMSSTNSEQPDVETETRIIQELISHESMPKSHRRTNVIAHAQLVNDKLYTESIDYVARDHLNCQDDKYMSSTNSEQPDVETETRINQELISHEFMPKSHRRANVVTCAQLVNDTLYAEPADYATQQVRRNSIMDFEEATHAARLRYRTAIC
jgi:beta-mannanase